MYCTVGPVPLLVHTVCINYQGNTHPKSGKPQVIIDAYLLGKGALQKLLHDISRVRDNGGGLRLQFGVIRFVSHGGCMEK